MANGGVILPIDDYVEQYMDQADLEDFHPLYQFLPTYKGKRWGFFDDGDVFALYYRTDIFGDPKLQQAYKTKFNPGCRAPDLGRVRPGRPVHHRSAGARRLRRRALPRKAGSPGNQFSFLQQYRANGGRFFDEATMKSQLDSEAGLKTFQQMIAANSASILGNNDMDAVAMWVAWLRGKVAMLISWPPTGRMSENYAQRDKAITFVPDRRSSARSATPWCRVAIPSMRPAM